MAVQLDMGAIPTVSDRAGTGAEGDGTAVDHSSGERDDSATWALRELVDELDTCLTELDRARHRAADLLRQRESGTAWLDIVSAESRPLVVEQISTVLGTLSTAGHAWRREQAAALQAEGVSINRIAALFNVTRQRISTLLRMPGAPPAD
ncbi:MAG: hypothetical protein JWP46_2075 [Modestobacter sp.]|nr:hypothetical protein [Modestobacter sp.]